MAIGILRRSCGGRWPNRATSPSSRPGVYRAVDDGITFKLCKAWTAVELTSERSFLI